MDLMTLAMAKKSGGGSSGGGGGSSLPAVTSADNGDLLGVVEGAWGKVDPPDDTYDVPFTVTAGAGGYEASTDADIDDALDAIAAGKKVRAVCDMGGGTYAYLAATAAVPESSAIVFETAGTSGWTPLLYSLKWTSLGTQLDVITIGLLPDVTSSDNGSLLGVSDGAWGKILPPEEIIYIPCTVTYNNGTYSAATTASFADTVAAALAGKTIIAKCDFLGESIADAQLQSVAADGSRITFSRVVHIAGAIVYFETTWTAEGIAVTVTPLAATT